VGPAKAAAAERLTLAWRRARAAFARDYNDRLFTGLIGASLAAVVLFRFVVRVRLAEAAGWAAFLFLELWPKLYVGPGTVYDTVGWRKAVAGWEAVAWIALELPGAPWVWVAACAAAAYYRRKRRLRRAKAQPVAGGGVRDLDV
jgi:hypothetical protein